MTQRVSSEKARAQWRELLDAAAAGQTVIIERYGRPVAVLSPYDDSIERQTPAKVREAAPEYRTVSLEELKEEIIAAVLAELQAIRIEPLPWHVGIEELVGQIKRSGSQFTNLTTEEIVERMRRTRQEIYEAEYAHLYR